MTIEEGVFRRMMENHGCTQEDVEHYLKYRNNQHEVEKEWALLIQIECLDELIYKISSTINECGEDVSLFDIGVLMAEFREKKEFERDSIKEITNG